MTNTNDSETNGPANHMPERIHVDDDRYTSGNYVVHVPSDLYQDFERYVKVHQLQEYVRADLYTQSQRELEQLKNERNGWCQLGVGSGDTGLFVHGPYGAIKAAQAKILELAEAQRELALAESAHSRMAALAKSLGEQLEQAQRELAEVKRERDEAHDKIIRMADEHFQDTRRVYGFAIERGRQENKEERDRYRMALERLLSGGLNDKCYYDHHGNCQAHFIEKPCSVALAREALNPPTPKPDDAVTREGG